MVPFDNIMLLTAELTSGVKPLIYVTGLTIPDAFYEGDHYILEKYEIPRSDTVALAQLALAMQTQQVLYYMGTSVYMSMYIYMGGYDLGYEPEWIDITRYFEVGLNKIIDNAADLVTNIYVYRVITRNGGVEHASSYISGIQTLTIEPAELLDWSGYPDLEMCVGPGSLYRYDRDGTMIVKGLPTPVINPRFQGPFEYTKEGARRLSMKASMEYLSDRIDALNAAFESRMTMLVSIADDIGESAR